jgi:hypothetical protein
MSNIRYLVAPFIAAILLACPVILSAAASSSVVANGQAAQTSAEPSTTKFESAQYYLKTPNEKKTTQIDGTFVLDPSAKAARFVGKAKTEVEIPYGSITSLLYERAATARYSAAVLVSPLFLFSKSKKHFLTIQYKNAEGQGQFALIRFDKSNWQAAVATVEAQTGIKVERVEEK